MIMESYPRTVEQVFGDFKGRRAGIIRALTTDADEFYRKCDPEKENMCLYGYPDEHWEVSLPFKVPMDHLPEPSQGINFARNGMLMQQKEWLCLVAAHSDAWLLSVAFYFLAKLEFDKADRNQLFHMINDLPTVLEVVRGEAEEQMEEKASVSSHSISSNESINYKQASESQSIYSKAVPSKDKDEDDMESSNKKACS